MVNWKYNFDNSWDIIDKFPAKYKARTNLSQLEIFGDGLICARYVFKKGTVVTSSITINDKGSKTICDWGSPDNIIKKEIFRDHV